MRLTSRVKGTEHHVTIPRHEPLRVGTLSAILAEVASARRKIRLRAVPLFNVVGPEAVAPRGWLCYLRPVIETPPGAPWPGARARAIVNRVG